MLSLSKQLNCTNSSKEGKDPTMRREAPTSCQTPFRLGQQPDLKMSDYINLVSGVGRQEDSSQPDHTYARPSVWRPQNHLVKPCRYLFSAVKDSCPNEDGLVDVESVADEPAIPLVLPQTEQPIVVEQRDAEPDSAADDDGSSWVDKVSKVGWSPVQMRILPKVVHIVEDFQLGCLAYKGRPNEQFLVESVLVASAAKLAHLLSSVGWERTVVQWLHALLIKNLTSVELDNYLLMLNLVKKKFPVVVDRMTAPIHVGRVTPAKEKPIEQLLKVMPVKNSLADQVAKVLLDEKFGKLPHDPIFVVIPNSSESLTTDRFSIIIKQLRQMATVHVVNYPAHSTITSIAHGLDQMVAEIRTLLAEVCSSSSGRPIILIGWNLGAAIACLVSQLERVQGIVCLGYPFTTIDWNHQQSNSSITDVSGALLFVIGAHSETATQEDMEDLRSQLMVPNQLVVVHGCNSQLVMSRKDRVRLCLTQSMVDRLLVVEIYNFVGELLTLPPLPPPEPSQNACMSTVLKHFPITSYKKKIKDPPAPFQHVPCKTTMSFIVNSPGRKATVSVSQPPLKRKPRVPPPQKLILFNSATCLSLLPHHNYAAKFQLQPLSVNNQWSVPPK